MTPQEIKLWVQLRYFKEQGFHFRRQVPFEPFIVDVAEKSAKLVIEVDGSQHSENPHEQKDRKRDEYLAGSVTVCCVFRMLMPIQIWTA